MSAEQGTKNKTYLSCLRLLKNPATRSFASSRVSGFLAIVSDDFRENFCAFCRRFCEVLSFFCRLKIATEVHQRTYKKIPKQKHFVLPGIFRTPTSIFQNIDLSNESTWVCKFSSYPPSFFSSHLERQVLTHIDFDSLQLIICSFFPSKTFLPTSHWIDRFRTQS